MRPKWRTAASTTFEAVSFKPMSPSTRTRSADGFSSFDLLTVRELPTTPKPRWSSARVMPNPRPLDAPVTIATCCSPAFLLMAFVSSFSIPPNHPKLVNGSENRCSFIFDKKYDELRWFRLTRVTAYGMNVFRRFVKNLPGTKPLKQASANLHLNFPFENIDNRMRIMPVDPVDGSRGVIDRNDFNLFTRSFRKQFRKE